MNKSFLIFTALFMSLLGTAKADDTLTLDPNTGNYILTHNGAQSVWVPGTKFIPTLQSWFEARENGSVTYRYQLKNGKDSQQTIHGVRMMVIPGVGNVTIPSGWETAGVPSVRGTDWAGLSWSAKDMVKNAVAPGKSVKGFSMSGPYLPEVAVAEMWHITSQTFHLNGRTDDESVMELVDFDTPAFNQLNDLMDHDYVSRYTAAPAIAIPSPFDPVAVLTAIQNHINQDLINFKLVDPTFAAQLNRLLQAAVAAATGGNTAALKDDIKDLRHMLKREHADVDKDDDGKGKEKDKSRQIDKLAAKVLDFDLKYIQKCLENKD